MHFKTNVLSDQNTDLSVGGGNSALSILSTLTDKAAAANSSLGMVCRFKGATLALPIRNAIWTFPSAFVILRLLTVP